MLLYENKIGTKEPDETDGDGEGNELEYCKWQGERRSVLYKCHRYSRLAGMDRIPVINRRASVRQQRVAPCESEKGRR